MWKDTVRVKMTRRPIHKKPRSGGGVQTDAEINILIAESVAHHSLYKGVADGDG